MRLFIGLLLTAVAGWVDAIGFLQLSGLYTSFMSGNTTQLGVSLGTTGGFARILPLALVAAFFTGAFTGNLLALLSGRWCLPTVLGMVSCLLGLAFWIFGSGETVHGVSLLLSGAMGAQNAALRQVKGVHAGTTYVTGTLFSAGRDLAAAVLGKGPRWRWLLHVAVWLFLMAGAAGGAATFGHAGRWSLGLPAILLALLTSTASIWVWRANPKAEN
ncbi:YoaK family protein [Microvirga sp. M2]|uniref:YoaK family protein n=1 Tax=Microvirga sp. M2 TaxID=3073270 RepID=UPI0039C3C3A4